MNRFLLILFSILCTSLSNCAFSQTDSIKILSWNVFLRPGILSDGQMKRVDSIAFYLNNSDADIIILQETFHRRSRKRLDELLKENYCSYTDAGPTSWCRVPSGVAIYSRTPLSTPIHYSYNNGIGSDNLAEKGFIYVKTEINGKPMGIIGTHLQAGGGEERKMIRREQFYVIQQFQDTIADSIPLLIGGDFNISRHSKEYGLMRDTLNAYSKLPVSSIKNTANFSDHDLFNVTGDPSLIDFILMRVCDGVISRAPVIEEPRQIKNGEHKRLSDHNPISTVFVFKTSSE